MFTVDGIRKFHSWTHACLNIVLDHVDTMPQDELIKDVPAFGFPTLQKQLTHVLNCEGLWIHALKRLDYVDRDPSEFCTLADIRSFQQQVSGRTLAYLSGMTDQQLGEDMEIRFPNGDLVARTPALVLHHVLTHAFHHKGQMVTMCRLLGHPAPDTDLNWFN